jgi:hypothetical protein
MDPSPQKKATKLPFKRTALKAKKSTGDVDPVDFFNRSAEIQPLLTADAKKRARREAEKEARTRQSPSVEKHDRSDDETGENDAPNSQKKRRTDGGGQSEDDMYDCTPPPR